MQRRKTELTDTEILALSIDDQIQWHRMREADAAARRFMAAEVGKTDVSLLARQSEHEHRARARELEDLQFRIALQVA